MSLLLSLLFLRNGKLFAYELRGQDATLLKRIILPKYLRTPMHRYLSSSYAGDLRGRTNLERFR